MINHSSKTGVLIVNVGTPEHPKKSAVRKYLGQFLTDKRVVALPAFLRYLLVYGIIVPFRTAKSTEAYQLVWDQVKGSPLLSISQSFTDQLQQVLGSSYSVKLAMRYGKPAIESVLQQMQQEHIDHIIVAPMYPQYASATNSSVLEKVFHTIKQNEIIPTVTTLAPFYNEPVFIQAAANRIAPLLHDEWDAVLFSYHGLPFEQVKRSEVKPDRNCYQDLPCPAIQTNNRHCYRAQCYETTRLLAKALQLSDSDYMVSFQSRVGFNRWIGPDTETAMKILIGKGKKRLVVACPSFVSDCLETLEEIKCRAQETWLAMGGESLVLAPCVNDAPDWVAGFADLIRRKIPLKQSA